MITISVRLTEKDKVELEKYGKISDLVRDAIRMYINNKRSQETLRKLKEYQKKNQVTTTTEEIIAMLKEDRDSR